MDRDNYDLELIQKILGHEDKELTLEYIDPDIERIDAAFKELWKNVQLPPFNDSVISNEV
jgi:hypothetical protein